eukprot:gene9528-12835_t
MFKLIRRSIIKPKHITDIFRYSTSESNPLEFDVVINGGGVVGMCCAASLYQMSKGNLRIGVIEGSALPEPTIDKKPLLRVYAISPKTKNVLESLGAWKYIEERSHPFNTMQIWESSGPGMVRFGGGNRQPLAYICEDSTIQQAIYKSIFENASVIKNNTDNIDAKNYKFPEFYFESTITNMERSGSNSIISIKNKVDNTSNIFHTKLLIGADGAQSTIRRMSSIGSWGWGYGQEALVATIKVEQPVKSYTAWQKYLPGGPLALLPLWDDYYSIVWSVSITESKRLRQLSKEDFIKELNETMQAMQSTNRWAGMNIHPSNTNNFPPFLNILSNILSSSSSSPVHGITNKIMKELSFLSDTIIASSLLHDPFQFPPKIISIENNSIISFPLSFQQANTYAIPGIALVGDAAHSIHPQAGQGLNLGILDSIALTQAIKESLGSGQDINSSMTMNQYKNNRYLQNLAMMSIVDGIHRIFVDQPPYHPISSTGTGTNSSIILESKQMLRTIGMLSIHGLGDIKNKISEFAMGQTHNNHHK